MSQQGKDKARKRQQVDEPGAYYSWSQEEQQVLIEKQATLGNKWGLISSFLPGRTPLAVQQHWYRFLRDKPAVGASSKASEDIGQANARQPKPKAGPGHAKRQSPRLTFPEPVPVANGRSLFPSIWSDAPSDEDNTQKKPRRRSKQAQPPDPPQDKGTQRSSSDEGTRLDLETCTAAGAEHTAEQQGKQGSPAAAPSPPPESRPRRSFAAEEWVPLAFLSPESKAARLAELAALQEQAKAQLASSASAGTTSQPAPTSSEPSRPAPKEPTPPPSQPTECASPLVKSEPEGETLGAALLGTELPDAELLAEPDVAVTFVRRERMAPSKRPKLSKPSSGVPPPASPPPPQPAPATSDPDARRSKRHRRPTAKAAAAEPLGGSPSPPPPDAAQHPRPASQKPPAGAQPKGSAAGLKGGAAETLPHPQERPGDPAVKRRLTALYRRRAAAAVDEDSRWWPETLDGRIGAVHGRMSLHQPAACWPAVVLPQDELQAGESWWTDAAGGDAVGVHAVDTLSGSPCPPLGAPTLMSADSIASKAAEAHLGGGRGRGSRHRHLTQTAALQQQDADAAKAMLIAAEEEGTVLVGQGEHCLRRYGQRF